MLPVLGSYKYLHKMIKISSPTKTELGTWEITNANISKIISLYTLKNNILASRTNSRKNMSSRRAVCKTWSPWHVRYGGRYGGGHGCIQRVINKPSTISVCISYKNVLYSWTLFDRNAIMLRIRICKVWRIVKKMLPWRCLTDKCHQLTADNTCSRATSLWHRKCKRSCKEISFWRYCLFYFFMNIYLQVNYIIIGYYRTVTLEI